MGDTDNYVSAVNPSGAVVVASSDRSSSAPQHLFLWDSTHGQHNLQDLLDAQARSRFTLEWKGSVLPEWGDNSINDAGEIVAFGQDGAGHDHLLLLTPHAA